MLEQHMAEFMKDDRKLMEEAGVFFVRDDEPIGEPNTPSWHFGWQ